MSHDAVKFKLLAQWCFFDSSKWQVSEVDVSFKRHCRQTFTLSGTQLLEYNIISTPSIQNWQHEWIHVMSCQMNQVEPVGRFIIIWLIKFQSSSSQILHWLTLTLTFCYFIVWLIGADAIPESGNWLLFRRRKLAHPVQESNDIHSLEWWINAWQEIIARSWLTGPSEKLY